MEHFNELFEKYEAKMREHRMWLHSHPELSNHEDKTADYIEAALKDMGLEPKRVGVRGVTALIKGGSDGPCVGLRADMDALPVQEETGLPFSSQNPGVAHVCGHDMHMTMLLGAAYVLNDMRESLKGSVKLIFQPAEETSPSGAEAVIRDGVLENPAVGMVIGQHVWPTYPLGQAALREGPMMASSDHFHITVHGKGSHGAAPENGIDAIVIASHIVCALQTVVSRNIDPQEGVVVTVGAIHGGASYNVVVDTVTLEGTCRTLNTAVHEKLPELMKRIVCGTAESLGGSADFTMYVGADLTSNCHEGFEHMSSVIREEFGDEGLVVPDKAVMISEDFCEYGKKVPSAFLWLGCRDPQKPLISLHNPHFAPEWETMKKGVQLLTAGAVKYLEKAGK